MPKLAFQCVFVILCVHLSKTVSQTTLFTPAMSAICSSTLTKIINELSPGGCGLILKNVLTSSSEFTNCARAMQSGRNCFNYVHVTSMGQRSRLSVPVYRVKAPNTCDLCTPNSGMIDGCPDLLTAIVGCVYGRQVNYSDFNITNTTTIATVDTLTLQAAMDCISPQDQASVHVLKDQSAVRCASSDTFGMNITAAGTIDDIVDLRAMPQCGQCAVTMCIPGQLCDGNGKAEMCPPGSYCPTPTIAIDCPRGYFCPLGSTEPVQCSFLAIYTCGEGSTRQIVWAPLMAALLLIIITWSCLRNQDEAKHKLNAAGHILKANITTIESSNSSKKSNSLHESMSRTAPVAIEFTDVLMITNNNTRLNHISGNIRPGKFTAIMGGSGAGKTSLINVIVGREAYTSGSVRYTSVGYKNGKESLPSSLLDRIVAYVPQTDVYLREMTVYELIMHSACCRLPTSLSWDEIKQRVEDVMEQLELTEIRDTTVGRSAGGSSFASSAEGKMVNIALELVTAPNILILDEPTSGVDSSTALHVARMISNLAHAGLTCVAVIHQPRAEIFELFDDMLILVHGGQLAYQGPAIYATSYFAHQGCVSIGECVNPTDFLIDATSVSIKVATQHVSQSEKITGSYDDTTGDYDHRDSLSRRRTLSRVSSTAGDNDGSGASRKRTLSRASSRKQAETWAELWAQEGEAFLNSMANARRSPRPLSMYRKSPRTPIGMLRIIIEEDSDDCSSAATPQPATPPTPGTPRTPNGSAKFKGWTAPAPSTPHNIEHVEQILAVAEPPSLAVVPPAATGLAVPSTDEEGEPYLPLDVPRPGFRTHLVAYFKRGFQQHLKQNIMLNDLVFNLVGGIMLGIATCGGPLLINYIPSMYTGSCPPGAEVKCNRWLRFQIGPATFIMTMILGSITVPLAIRTFGREKEVFSREVAVGANKLAYFLGKMLSDVPFLALNVFVFMSPIVAIAPWQSPTDKLYSVLFCIAFTVSAMGYCLAYIFADIESAVLTGVICATLLNIFSGFLPKIADGEFGKIMYTQWAARGITACELYFGQGITDIQQFNRIVPFAWQDPNYKKDCGNLLLIALVLLGLAFFALLIRNRRVATSFH